MSGPLHERLKASYRATLARHGTSPPGVKMSAEGQRDRFEQLASFRDLQGASVADVGCGLGDLYGFLRERLGPIDYTGIDILPEAIERARRAHPDAHFLQHDVVSAGLPGDFDVILLSAVGNDAMPDATAYLRSLVFACFPHARQALGFNFISSHASVKEPELAYHDPAGMLDWCIREVTPRVRVAHYYARADVAMFLEPLPAA